MDGHRQYLPLFARLERELALLQEQQALLERAKAQAQPLKISYIFRV